MCRTERRVSSGGQAVVELALVLPILIIMMIGAIDFARLAGGYVSLQHAVVEGLRLGVVGHDDAAITDRVKTAAAAVDAGAITVTITPAGAARTPGSDLAVEAVYAFRVVAPVLRDLLGDPLLVRARAVGRVE